MRAPLCACLAAVGLAGAAAAQVPDDAALARTDLFAPDPEPTVRERSRPEYAAQAVPVGGVLLTPILGAEAGYDDNIYATRAATVGDAIFRVQPSLAITSDWARDQVQAFARASENAYAAHPAESTLDWSAGASGRLDVRRDWGVALAASYAEETEPRTASDSPRDLRSPIRYAYADADAETTRQAGRLRLTVRTDLQDFTYADGRAPDGGPVYQQDRDEQVVSGAARAEFALAPQTAVFLDVEGDRRDFDHRLSIEPTRNSAGYLATVGADLDLTHLLRGEVGVGYLEQDYRAGAYRPAAGVAFRGSLDYLATPLTTFTLSGSRTVVDSDILGDGAYLSSNYALQVDHELRRNLILTARLGYGLDAYAGVDRTDTRLIGDLGATRLLTRTVGISLKYRRYHQDSSGVARGPAFDVDSLTAAVVYQVGG